MEEINALNWYQNPDGFTVSKVNLLGEDTFFDINTSDVTGFNIDRFGLYIELKMNNGVANLINKIGSLTSALISLSDGVTVIDFTIILSGYKRFSINQSSVSISLETINDKQAVQVKESYVSSN